LIIQQNC